MTALNKQALRSTSDRDWFDDWFKREFHPDKTGPYIKDQLFFAVLAARAPLLDELEAAEKRIAELEARKVTLPDERFRYGESDYDDGYVNGWNAHGIETKSALRAAGIGVKGE
ncbi:hypothetical protein FDW86_09140 [Citrobacter sp. wls828]|nr:hypothetical protein FDW86_09140 [Citrobacter sp. wls828]